MNICIGHIVECIGVPLVWENENIPGSIEVGRKNCLGVVDGDSGCTDSFSVRLPDGSIRAVKKDDCIILPSCVN